MILGYFPPTPVDTPFHSKSKHEQTNTRFLDNYDTSMEETIKPKNHKRHAGNFEDMRKEAAMNHMPTPPTTASMPPSNAFDSAPMPSGSFVGMPNLNMGYIKHEKFDGLRYSPASSNISPSYHIYPRQKLPQWICSEIPMHTNQISVLLQCTLILQRRAINRIGDPSRYLAAILRR